MLRAVEMAAEDMRGRGVDLDVRAVDDKESEAVAAQVAAELVADSSVVAVIGHKNSGPSKAAAPVYAAAGLTQVTQCSTDNALSRSGWRTFFRLCADNERQAAVAAEHVHARLPSRASSRSTTAPTTASRWSRIRAQLQLLSGRQVTVLEMSVGQEEFTGIVGAVKSAGAERRRPRRDRDREQQADARAS